MIWHNVVRSGRDLIEVLSLKLLGGTGDNHEDTQDSGRPCRGLIRAPPEYKSETLQFEQTWKIFHLYLCDEDIF
jgi:hypothetical protein